MYIAAKYYYASCKPPHRITFKKGWMKEYNSNLIKQTIMKSKEGLVTSQYPSCAIGIKIIPLV